MNPAGTYSATLKRGVLSKTKASGSLQAAVVFDVEQYWDGQAWTPVGPFERTVFLSFSGKAKDYTKQKLAALGFTDPSKVTKDEETGDQVLQFPAESLEKPVELLCTEDTYNGETKERWDLKNWGGGVTGDKADDEDVMRLASLW